MQFQDIDESSEFVVAPVQSKKEESIERIMARYDGTYTGDEKCEYTLMAAGYCLFSKKLVEGEVVKHYVRTRAGVLDQVWIKVVKSDNK